MTLFFISVLLIYGAVHLYVFIRVRAAIELRRSTEFLIAIFMVLMTFAPFIVRMSERAGFEWIALIVAYAGYIWMGAIFLFFSCSLVMDIYRVLLALFGFIFRKDTIRLRPSAITMFFLPLIASVAITGYGFMEARMIRTERVVIGTSKLPSHIERLRIVQISDVHLGLIVKQERLGHILESVKEESPDLLVSTGDLVDAQLDSLEGLAEMLREINPPYGKYAVTGNHEFYAGLGEALHFIKLAGFRLLRAEGITVNGIINIAGVDDRAGRRYGTYREISERALLSKFRRDRFTLLLKHRPVIDSEAEGLFDLQLSGHTHKGQIYPFRILTRLYYPNLSGLIKLDQMSLLYVSRGSGTWGPPIRFLSPPEVTVIDIVNEGT
jgi:predicted MPP superfamily phosphohydrolase